MSASESVPFLTVDTGEAYQPIRLTFSINNLAKLSDNLAALSCVEQSKENTWRWFWRNEVSELPFASIDNCVSPSHDSVLLGTFVICGDLLYLNLHSFKRACLAIPFFYQEFAEHSAQLRYADFINKVYHSNETIMDEFSNLFSERELQDILRQRLQEYQAMQEECENARDIDHALKIVKSYASFENKKKISFIERYEFNFADFSDPSLIFLSFYVFIRSRELAAIRRWFGRSDYSLADAVEETMQQIFGDVGVDLVD